MGKVYRYQINNTCFLFNNMIYIDPNGNDFSGNGSKDKPYKTIKKAVSMVNIDNTAIILNAGNYYERINSYGNNNAAGTNCLFSTTQYKITFIGQDYRTIVNTEFNIPLCSVAAVGQADCNIYNLIVKIKCSYVGDNTSNYFLAGNNKYNSNLNIFNCAFQFLSSINQIGIYYDNLYGKISATNCGFYMGSDDNSWPGVSIGTSVFIAKNCIFKDIRDWRSFGGGTTPPHISLTNCIKNNNNYWNQNNTMIDGGNNIIFDVISNINYYPTNTVLWKSSGINVIKNADNSVSNIGPYGGIYQWASDNIIPAKIDLANMTKTISKGDIYNFDFNISPVYTQNLISYNSSSIQSFNDNLNITYLYNIDKNIWKNISKIEVL